MGGMVAHLMAETACLFCSIIAGATPAAIVLDEPGAVGFLDTRPVFLGHVLVVPRDHFRELDDLPESQIPAVFGAARRVAGAVKVALEADGSFVAMNNSVSQSVPHLHVHVVPRRKGDGLRGFFWPRTKYEDHGAMLAVADRIRSQLQRAT